MVQEVQYKVIKNIGSVEIRQYPEVVLATVSGYGDNEAFGLLFRYISGRNKTSGEVEMTAPVISTENCMAFILPPELTLETAPEPTNPQVRLRKMEPRRMAVLRFRGRTGQNAVQKRTTELLDILENNNIKTVNKPLLMRYNPPFIPGIFRRNEVGAEIE